MPWLSTCPSSSGSSDMLPTTTGTPMASVAAMIPALTSASSKGSTAVEFSGHTTRSGWVCSPAATDSASSWVSRTWLAVTSRLTATTSRPVPGTSPCTAATVALPLSATSNGTSTGAMVTTASPASTAGAVRVMARRCTSSQASVVPVRATRKLTPVIPIHGSASAHGVSAVA